MKKFQTVIVLFLICSTAALLLAGLNVILGPIISENEQIRLENALNKMYEFDTLNEIEFESITTKYPGSIKIVVKEKYQVLVDEVVVATIYKVEGYNGYSKGNASSMLVGFNEVGVVTKIEVLSVNQSAGKSDLEGFGEKNGEYINQSNDYLFDVKSVDTYSGATFGANMMNYMVLSARDAFLGGNE